MNSTLAVAALISFVSLMLVLPLVPAFVELKKQIGRVATEGSSATRWRNSSFCQQLSDLHPSSRANSAVSV